ncbi:MAG: pyridoxal phosphate-dependent aminotransferase [Alphaproteobacteria bacterium]|nr:MAG: pyridoxal phosphate-dependent aminotransferase [Alphaproteobacteria bacterium]
MTDFLHQLRGSIGRLPESGIVELVNYGRDHEGLIPLWAGESDFPTPDHIMDAAVASMRAGETTYTYQRGIPELRQALADYHSRVYGQSFEMDRFYVTGSGMQAIQIAVQCIVGEGDEVIVPSPGWPNAPAAIEIAGGRPVSVPLRCDEGRWTFDLEAIAAAITPKTRAIFINSPANPTGAVLSREDLLVLRDLSRQHGVWICADEVYGRFFFEGGVAPSTLEVFEPDDLLLVLNTFSKNWAMTGWRVGWIVAPRELGQVMENMVQYSTSGVPIFSQRACVVALNEGETFLGHQIDLARRARDLIVDGLQQSNRTIVAPPEGSFYLFFGLEGEQDSRALALRLVDEANVGLAPGSAFGPGGEGFLRLCFAGSIERLEQAVERLIPALK